ncbi:FAD-binding protein [Sorangium sp. So ce385]|uniref:FAD-binding protein n=1 Tax=Sorangium sp. So ce385 TaxID=3133308 RepID=UPI003F5BE26F
MKTNNGVIAPSKQWINFFGNIQIKPRGICKPYVSSTSGSIYFRETVSQYQELIANAAREDRKIRAYGGSWSLSESAVCNDYMVNTIETNNINVGLSADDSVAKHPDQLVLTQCGARIRDLHDRLGNKGLALPTTGASEGQTIAGAVSTGTHGSAFNVGAMSDYVVAIHLLTASGSVWLERANDPISTQKLRDELGVSQFLQDDELFAAALVSFGSFGIIHAFVLRCVPQYKLRVFAADWKYEDLEANIMKPDFPNLKQKLKLASDLGELFHFEVIVNPYTQHAYLRYMDKVPHDTDPRSPGPDKWSMTGLLSALNVLSDGVHGLPQRELGRVIGKNIRDMLPLDQRSFVDLPQNIFGPTKKRIDMDRAVVDGYSTEIGLHPSDLGRFFHIAFDVAKKTSFNGAYALRYVKQTRATLGWTLFEPVTAVIETPMTATQGAKDALRELWRRLRESKIPHTFHWGQCLPVRPIAAEDARLGDAELAAARNQVLAQYQHTGRLARWKAARKKLLPDESARRMFSNKLTEALDLGVYE